ncbi:four helix bundle protein [Maribacter sp. 2210JD10-5]|uniref:four helix bundle protein n=1 Tax=Maribacter sp. 2210JD10-5 TaxID=3386272 RepID=UPI0039BD5472
MEEIQGIKQKNYRLTTKNNFSKDFALRDQIRRASISISSNIAEGYGRKTNKEFVYFLNVAQASCYEVNRSYISPWILSTLTS